VRADPAPRTLRPVLPHQARRPDRWAQYPDGAAPVPFGWFGRWSRRSRLAATVVVIVSLALVGALVISSAQAVKAVAGTNDEARYEYPLPVAPSEAGYLPGYRPAENP
jgi:hypothetical protein